MPCHHLLSFSTYVAKRLVPNIWFNTFGYSLHSHLLLVDLRYYDEALAMNRVIESHARGVTLVM
jgi:hypothetical protein